MNTTQLIDKVAKSTKLGKAQVKAVINGALGTIQQEVKKRGGKVSLTGFGSFQGVKRKARNGINPQTQEKIKIAAVRVPRFRPGSEFKALVSNVGKAQWKTPGVASRTAAKKTTRKTTRK